MFLSFTKSGCISTKRKLSFYFFSPAVIVIFLIISTLEVVSKLLAPNVLQICDGRDFYHKSLCGGQNYD